MEIHGLFSGSVLLDGASTINLQAGAALIISGAISGTGPLIETGPGSLELSGAANNTYSGDTMVSGGTLYLSKNQFVTAVPGNLVLGPASASAPASAVFSGSGAMAGSVATVDANSVLNLNGTALTLSQLNLNDGGGVLTGSGVLDLSPEGSVNVGSLNLHGSQASAAIYGNIGLTPNDLFVAFNVAPYAPFAAFAGGPELNILANVFVTLPENPRLIPTRIVKNGLGNMRLGGSSTLWGAPR